jgi:nucleotide-binding universal stress UspA family protein
MIELKRILVPIDFSQTSKAALRYGVELARQFSAQIHLLHVPEPLLEWPGATYAVGVRETMQRAECESLRHLLTDTETRELRPECAVRLGTPSSEIVRYAEEHEIDVIVMGTHGRTGVARVLMGSVAEAVVRTAPCPVLTMHRRGRESVVADEPIQRSVLATTVAQALAGGSYVRPDYGQC